MRGNHHDQEIALLVLLLFHHGVYEDVPMKLADLGHKVNYGMKDPGSLKKVKGIENEKGKGKKTWGIDIETDKLSHEIE